LLHRQQLDAQRNNNDRVHEYFLRAFLARQRILGKTEGQSEEDTTFNGKDGRHPLAMCPRGHILGQDFMDGSSDSCPQCGLAVNKDRPLLVAAPALHSEEADNEENKLAVEANLAAPCRSQASRHDSGVAMSERSKKLSGDFSSTLNVPVLVRPKVPQPVATSETDSPTVAFPVPASAAYPLPPTAISAPSPGLANAMIPSQPTPVLRPAHFMATQPVTHLVYPALPQHHLPPPPTAQAFMAPVGFPAPPPAAPVAVSPVVYPQ